MRAHVAGRQAAPTSRKGLEEALRTDAGEQDGVPAAARHPGVDRGAAAIVGVAIVLQDVTRLLRFDELKNDLVATVAHEFRTPLTSLRMAIHLCLEEAVGPLTEKQADLLYAARQDCERLQQIVDDLLDLSRIQSGRIELHQRAGRRRARSRATPRRPSARRPRRRASSCGSSCCPAWATVVADPERIDLAFANLVGNAVRYTPAGGRDRRSRRSGATARSASR